MNILITGTSHGIGQKLARFFAGQGHQIWGLARSEHKSFEEECRDLKGSFRYSLCDVSQSEQVDQLQQSIARDWGRLDALIHCAGVQGPIGPVHSMDAKAWEKSLATNLNGTFYVLRATFSLLRKATRRAKVICFSGGGSTSPRPNFTPYAVAKAGVVRLVENVAQEWKGFPIDVNAIAPGAVNTRMTEEVLRLGPEVAGEKDFQTAQRQMQTGGTPFEVYAGLIEFLLQPQSDGITGRLLSAPWDPWKQFPLLRDKLDNSDIFTLRRIVPTDRGQNWSLP